MEESHLEETPLPSELVFRINRLVLLSVNTFVYEGLSFKFLWRKAVRGRSRVIISFKSGELKLCAETRSGIVLTLSWWKALGNLHYSVEIRGDVGSNCSGRVLLQEATEHATRLFEILKDQVDLLLRKKDYKHAAV